MTISFKKEVLPHLIAVVTFFLVVFAFFNPVFLDGKVIEQHDILQAEGAAKEIRDFRQETGEEPLWTNSMFGGMPAYLITTEFDADVLNFLREFLSLGIPHPAHIIFTAMLACYIMLVVFGVRPYLAIAGAIAYGLSSFFVISIVAGHNSKVWAMAYMPAVLAGIQCTLHRNRWAGLALTTLALGLEIRVNHLQVTYYLFLLILIYLINELYWAYRAKTIPLLIPKAVILGVAVVIALGANIGRLWTVYEYGQYSIRGKSELTAQGNSADTGLDKEYAFRWSNGIAEPLTLIIPNFFGGGSQEDVGSDSKLGEALKDRQIPAAQIREFTSNAPMYWGDQPVTAGPIYAGAVICFLFILSIVVLPNRHRVWLGITFIFCLMLSWGYNFSSFNDLMFDFFPGYNKFRSVTMIIVMALMILPLGGFLAVEYLISSKWSPGLTKKFYLASGVTGSLLILIFIFAGVGSYEAPIDARFQQGGYPTWIIDAIRDQRQSMLKMDALRSLFFISVAIVSLYFYSRKKISLTALSFILAVLVTLDIYTVSHRYIGDDNYNRSGTPGFFTMTPADKVIMQDTTLSYRVLNVGNPWNDARTSYYHQSVGGYHGAKMRRYADLIERCLTNEVMQIQTMQANNSFGQLNILNMLNTRYFIGGGLSERDVVQNPEAYGNAWFVSEIQGVNTPDEEIQQLCSLDTRTTAVVDIKKFPGVETRRYNGNGSIRLTTYKPGTLIYEANTPEDAFAVFSEIYYPAGWHATIDGNPVETVRANYVLRGLNIPSGKHTVKFRFEPGSYYTGNTIQLIFNIVLILVVAGGFAFAFISSRKTAKA